MKLKLLLFGCLAAGINLGVNAQQIINSVQSDVQLWGAPNNTGLAVAPEVDIQAAVFDDGSGNYYINWIEGASGGVVDQDNNSGNDPDVAYYRDFSMVGVAFENGGDIFIDEYYLTSYSSTSSFDYSLGATFHVSSGQYPNIDIASYGEGIITWEDGGDIFACGYKVFSGVGPIVHVGTGHQPDAIATDDPDIAAITYITPSGDVVIETISFPDLWAGGHSVANSWTFPPTDFYQFPRIASDRQLSFGGDPLNFTVVVQDYGPTGSAAVDGFFVMNGATMSGAINVNNDFLNCWGDYPLPVVTYQYGLVRVAWSQYHPAGCSVVAQSGTTTSDDVLMQEFDPAGNSTTGDYEQVNQLQSNYISYSKNAIASNYDGAFSVSWGNEHGGILYSDQGDVFWKGISAVNPNYMNETISADRGNNFSLVTSPVDQTIEVLSESDDFATFEMLDNAGRVVELKTISNEGNVYSIDISHLSGGMYFLNCSSKSNEEVLRVLQLTK